MKFADYTILTGLNTNEDETICRWEINHLMTWCRENNLELNTLKTVEKKVDFGKSPPILCESPVSSMEPIIFLGTVITQEDLKWEKNISSLIR